MDFVTPECSSADREEGGSMNIIKAIEQTTRRSFNLAANEIDFNYRVNGWLCKILAVRNNRNDEHFGFFCIQM